MKAFVILGLSVWLVAVGSAAPRDVPAGERRVYAESGGGPQELELFFPPRHDRAKKVPGMILFHGGAWISGSRVQLRPLCSYFAGRGLVCATADYRMLTNTEAAALPSKVSRKRVCVDDARRAIRWFQNHAGELGVDPERIIVGGGSAGGHISALATLNSSVGDAASREGIERPVAAYLWFNPAFEAGDAHDAEVDVLRYVNKNLAPAVVFFGTQDPYKKGWDVACAKWRSAGVTSIEVYLAEGQGHGFFNKEPWKTLTWNAADQFLVKHGLLEGKAAIAAPSGGRQLVLESDAALQTLDRGGRP